MASGEQRLQATPASDQKPPERMWLSTPHMSGREEAFVAEAFASNWIAPVGPHLAAFEQEFCAVTGASHAVSLSSGTAALHLALKLLGIGAGDEVAVSTFTFAASVNPIRYLGAEPVLIDSERDSWNMDPARLEEAIASRAAKKNLPRAVVVVHLYGQCADMAPISEICRRYGIPLIEDAAEALGSTYRGHAAGTLADIGIFSFNGNKIITTSGGGMLVTRDPSLIENARHLATQARDPAPHYQHSEVGYNYRLSNVLAGIGRAQLEVLEERVRQRRANFAFYEAALGDLPGIRFMPEARWGRHTRWLTTLTVDPEQAGTNREKVRRALEDDNIEARPVWKPMHQQPVFARTTRFGGAVADELFEDGLCLPSGSNLSQTDLERVVDVVRRQVRPN